MAETDLAKAWRLAYDDEAAFTENVAWFLFDMLVVLDESTVMREFEERERLRSMTLDQEPAALNAASLTEEM